MITLRQLQFALAVARHRHFKRASEECNVSQSALSLGIAELEKNLGVALFERNNKQVLITPIGEELLERAQKIFLDTRQLMDRAHSSQEIFGFNLSVGFIPTIAPFLLPAALGMLRTQYPRFEMQVLEDQSERLITALQTGRIDVAIMALPYDTAGMQVFPIAQENFRVVMHKDHPLAKNTKISPTKLRRERLLLLGEGHCFRDHVADVCKFQRGSIQETYRDASLHTLIQLAANNMGITFIPELANHYVEAYSSELVSLPLEGPAPHRTLAAVTRNNYPRQRDIHEMIRIFQEAIAKTIA